MSKRPELSGREIVLGAMATLSLLGLRRALHNNQKLKTDLDGSRWAFLQAVNDAKKNRALADRDALTDLYNRRGLEASFSSITGLLQRNGGEASLIALDLDRFKSLNDTSGHGVGDVALINAANVLRENLRTEDIIARTGGEELVILTPETSEEKAAELANRLRALIESEEMITASFGVAPVNVYQDLATNLFRADEALYVAKDSGRNKVVKYSSLPQAAPINLLGNF